MDAHQLTLANSKQKSGYLISVNVVPESKVSGNEWLGNWNLSVTFCVSQFCLGQTVALKNNVQFTPQTPQTT
jgi:hypothetical protein